MKLQIELHRRVDTYELVRVKFFEKSSSQCYATKNKTRQSSILAKPRPSNGQTVTFKSVNTKHIQLSGTLILHIRVQMI